MIKLVLTTSASCEDFVALPPTFSRFAGGVFSEITDELISVLTIVEEDCFVSLERTKEVDSSVSERIIRLR